MILFIWYIYGFGKRTEHTQHDFTTSADFKSESPCEDLSLRILGPSYGRVWTLSRVFGSTKWRHF